MDPMTDTATLVGLALVAVALLGAGFVAGVAVTHWAHRDDPLDSIDRRTRALDALSDVTSDRAPGLDRRRRPHHRTVTPRPIGRTWQ